MATAVPLLLGCAHAARQCRVCCASLLLLCFSAWRKAQQCQGIHPVPSCGLSLSCALLLLFWVPFTLQRRKWSKYKDRDANWKLSKHGTGREHGGTGEGRDSWICVSATHCLSLLLPKVRICSYKSAPSSPAALQAQPVTKDSALHPVPFWHHARHVRVLPAVIMTFGELLTSTGFET